MRTGHVVFVLLAALIVCAPLQADVLIYDVSLDASIQQVPPNGSPATGSALLTLDTVADTLLVDLTYTGLTTPAVNAHIHCCAAPGTNGPVLIPFVPAGFVTGSTSGTFDALFNLTGAEVADIQSGLSYINIHTSVFPGGEIRGNITAATLVTPEPASLGLLCVSVLGVALLRRTRKNSVAW